MDIDDRLQYAERILGDQANKFFDSDIGQFVIARSAAAVKDSTEELIDVDPGDTKKIRHLQQNIAIAKIGLAWLNEALNIARQRYAIDEIEDEIVTEDIEF